MLFGAVLQRLSHHIQKGAPAAAPSRSAASQAQGQSSCSGYTDQV